VGRAFGIAGLLDVISHMGFRLDGLSMTELGDQM
jgi:hypothetical protein